MRDTLRFGNRTVEASRYGGMLARFMGTDKAELKILLKAAPAGPNGPAQPRDYFVIHGRANIEAAVAEIIEAFEPDEPDWYWQGLGVNGGRMNV